MWLNVIYPSTALLKIFPNPHVLEYVPVLEFFRALYLGRLRSTTRYSALTKYFDKFLFPMYRYKRWKFCSFLIKRSCLNKPF